MKKFYLLVFLLPLFAISLKAQIYSYHWQTTVGVQPVGVIRAGAFHIFCAGYDANFNGILDSGDVKPSWWTEKIGILSIDGTVEETRKVRDFEFGSWDFFAPFNPGMYQDDSFIYISQFGRIRSYDMNSYQLIDDSVVIANATAIWAGKDSLIYSVRNGNSGKVFIFDLKNKKLLDSVDGDVNVQKVMKFNGGIAILNEGTYGQNDSKLIIARKMGTTWNTQKITLGNGANDFDVFQGAIAVTMNGSHQVLIYSIMDNAITKTIETGTTGYDGPRSVRFFGKETGSSSTVAVSTYSGDVRFYSTSTGNLLYTLKTTGKAEGFDFQDTKFLVVANQFGLGKYTPDSTITVYSNYGLGSVEDEIVNLVKIYPNPSNDIVNIDFSGIASEISSIRIINTQTNVQFTFTNEEIQSGKLTFSSKKNNLGSGQYFVEILWGNLKIGIPFLVVR